MFKNQFFKGKNIELFILSQINSCISMLLLYIYNYLCDKSNMFKSADGTLRIVISVILKYYIETTFMYFECGIYMGGLLIMLANDDEQFFNRIHDNIVNHGTKIKIAGRNWRNLFSHIRGGVI